MAEQEQGKPGVFSDKFNPNLKIAQLLNLRFRAGVGGRERAWRPVLRGVRALAYAFGLGWVEAESVESGLLAVKIRFRNGI